MTGCIAGVLGRRRRLEPRPGTEIWRPGAGNPIPDAALLRTAGRGIVMPGGQHGGAQNKAPYLIQTEKEGRKAVRSWPQGRSTRQDVGRRPEQNGQKADPAAV